MKKLILALSCLVLIVSPLASQGDALAQENISPTLDILLLASNANQPPVEVEQTPEAILLTVTTRSGPVSLTTRVSSESVSSTVETDTNPEIPGATIVFTATLPTLTDFTIEGVATFEDAQQSTIEFVTQVPGKFEDVPSVINGVPFLRGGFSARVTNGTGQFANMEGIVTGNLLLDISRPGLQNAIEFSYYLFRLAPLP